MEPFKLKSILFLGDSFTWGQGLQYYHLIENEGWDWKKCSNFLESRERFENLGYGADEYRRINSFPNLVCKELNCRPIIPQQENGGDNPRIIDILENLDLFVTHNEVDCIIIQFSCPSRINENERYKYKSIDEIINSQIQKVEYLSNVLNDRNIPWFGLAWKPEVGDVLNTKYSENHIPIQYKGNEYNSIDIERGDTFHKLLIGGNDKINDWHPNLEGHKVIKDSIIHKLTRVRPPFERIGN